MKISIIGSFRKYYEEIKQLIILLQKNDFEVLSPKFSEITHSIEDFVVFASDNHNLTTAEIQTETLNRILKSDVVYVYDPDGYIGRTTCYEIGILQTTMIPLIFMDSPKDLPISICNENIMKPSKFVYSYKNKGEEINSAVAIVIDKYKKKSEMRRKNIMICGSMMFYDKMMEISKKLEDKGIAVTLPREESSEKETLSEEEFNDFKRRVSNQYLSKIRDNSTYGILVINEEKKGIENYIGPNTLVEISMAFCWGRSIFLYNDFYEPLKDELLAWKVKTLKGNLNELINEYQEARYVWDVQLMDSADNLQLELGDIDEHFYPLLR